VSSPDQPSSLPEEPTQVVRTPAPPRPTEPVPTQSQAAPIEDAPSISLHHSRSPASSRRWLWVALPIAGLSIVPLIGLVYAATATFGKGAEAEEATDVEAGGDGGVAKKGKTKGKTPKSTTKPRTDGAAECCAKLRELGKTAPLDARASYLSAAQACEAAPDEERAFKIAKSNVQTAKHELPDECNQ
jgi:hypothetical protein